MSYVHELCLVKWLLAKNIRHCDLCKRQFVIKEEVGSVLEIAKELLSQTCKSKKRIVSALIYLIYLYFFSKRFYLSSKYFTKVIVRGLIGIAKTYIELAKAELKFLLKIFTLPWQDRKLESLLKAQKAWVQSIALAFLPSWLLKMDNVPTRLGRLLVCLRFLKEALLYVYNCLLLKQLLRMGISEGLRIKRIITRTVYKTRRLRVTDSAAGAPQQ